MNALKIVLPDGSMQEVVMNLFARAGLPVMVSKKRTKEGRIAVDWIERVVFQRPQEIPHYLKNGHFDVAIVGEDWVANWGYEFTTLLKLPIGRSGNKSVRIVLAVSESSGIADIEALPRGAEIATEYVQLVEDFFQKRGQHVHVTPSYGNTEHKIRYGATAIVDVTESGESLRENGLKVIHTIMESQTVMVTDPNNFEDDEKKFRLTSLAQFIAGAAKASQFVMLIANVPDNVIDQAAKIIGGLKGPSCSSLREVSGWSALQSMVPRENEQKIILNLRRIGVTDIIVNRDLPLVMS